ncbi:MAG: NAD(P)-binding domain-containing protein [Dermatophilaceae bacterium]
MSPTAAVMSPTAAAMSHASAVLSQPSDEAPPATVVALIAHARGVPSVAREAFAAKCHALQGNDSVIIVHTCHRVEMYAALGSFAEGELPELPPGGLRLEDADAARHLISVACGLQSAVLGEDQVLHQVRETYVLRHAEQPLNPVLDRLFQVALTAGRRAHEWFGGAKRSLGDAALNEIEARAGTLTEQPILVVGAGSMGRLTAQAAARCGAQVVVTSRTAERAVCLAHTVGGQSIAGDVDGTLPPVVGVVVALSGPWQVQPLDAQRLVDSGATVVDLSSPPAVPDSLQTALGDRFVSIDDLAWGPQAELPGGLRGRLEQLVSGSGREYCRWLLARDSTPAIQAMSEAAEGRRLSELEWLFRRLPNLSEQERALIDQMSHRLVGGILHAPKSALRLDETGTLSQAAWELFGL